MSKATTLAWPPHFPPTDPWKKFFIGVRKLGPDISFFDGLKQLQASRTQDVMVAWPDERQRNMALIFGDSIRRHAGWKTPYFVPEDKVITVVYGPHLLEFEEPPCELAIPDFEERIGRQLGDAFWRNVIDWSDRNVPLGELMRVLAGQLAGTK